MARPADWSEGDIHAGQSEDALGCGLTGVLLLGRLRAERGANGGERGSLAARSQPAEGADLLEAARKEVQQKTGDEVGGRETMACS
jgi:hypothetical protein